MGQYAKSFKVCATCRRWAGMRNVNMGNSLVLIQDNACGKCVGGGFHMAQMRALACCPKWERWLI